MKAQSTASTTVWMNVTTSHGWRRPSVGVVRVESTLAQEMERLYPTSRFKRCIWRDGQFYELTDTSEKFLPTADSVAANGVLESMEAVSQLVFPVVSRRQALLQIGQGFLSLCPARSRPAVSRLLAYAKPKIARILSSRLIGWLRRGRSSTSDTGVSTSPSLANEEISLYDEQSIFQAGDVLISVGLDWDYEYYRRFYFLRKELGVKVVTCCYDLIPVLYPQYCVSNVANLFTSYFLDVADGSDLVLCISQQTEKDFQRLIDETGGNPVRTHVFPLGDNVPPTSGEISDAVAVLVRERFILFVSTIERRKNHEVLYRAYHLLSTRGHYAELPKLVFVGMSGWGVGDLLKDIELDPAVRGLIVQLNHVNDAELRLLYEASLFCVYPSLYEGWGLPVGEALALGKVVLSSDRGSLPEVGGSLVRYVDPWSPNDWAEEILSLVNDSEERIRLGEAVKRSYRVKTWSDSARSIKMAVDQLLDEPLTNCSLCESEKTAG